MIGPPDEQRDQLAAAAEAYDEALQPGSKIESDFELEHPGLARTVRMLNTVFRLDTGSDPSNSGEPPPPITQIGRFKVERCLGSGGFGSVWLGYDPLLKREVAI